MNGYRTLVRNHDFTLLWVGQTVSELGSRMSLFVFPLLAYHLTGSPMVAALTEGAHLLGLCAALLPAGALADRLDRRRLMRASAAAGALLYLSLVAAALTGALTLPHLIAVAVLGGATTGLFGPAELSAVRTVVATEDLPTALSQNQARQHVAALVGGPVGGALYAVTRWLPFVVDVASYAVAWVLLGRIRADLSAPAVDAPRQRPLREIADGLAFVRRSPFMRVQLVWASLSNLVINALFFAALLRLIQAGFPAVQIGLVETAAGVSGILGALVAPGLIDRFATGRLTIAVAWSWVPLVVPLVLVTHPAVVALALGAGVFWNPAGNAGIQSYRIAVTPAHLQGRIQSTSQFVAMSTLPLAPLLGGVLLARVDGGVAMAVLGALTALVALIPTLSRHMRGVPRPRDWRTPAPVTTPVAA